jgi:hypothetical protein
MTHFIYQQARALKKVIFIKMMPRLSIKLLLTVYKRDARRRQRGRDEFAFIKTPAPSRVVGKPRSHRVFETMSGCGGKYKKPTGDGKNTPAAIMRGEKWLVAFDQL